MNVLLELYYVDAYHNSKIMCADVCTPRYGGQQDYPIDRFMGVCSRSFCHGIQEYQTKKIRGDYPGSGHLEAKDPKSCGWCILMGLQTRDLILHLFNSSVVSICMCCVTPSLDRDAFLL
jgi:hypothetical protein